MPHLSVQKPRHGTLCFLFGVGKGKGKNWIRNNSRLLNSPQNLLNRAMQTNSKCEDLLEMWGDMSDVKLNGRARVTGNRSVEVPYIGKFICYLNKLRGKLGKETSVKIYIVISCGIQNKMTHLTSSINPSSTTFFFSDWILIFMKYITLYYRKRYVLVFTFSNYVYF